MKTIKLVMVIAAAFLITMGLVSPALAFHDGAVAHCDGCHTMHNSLSTDPVDGKIDPKMTVGAEPGGSLTRGSDPSSTCLRCHEGAGSYHIMSTTGENLTPGGDFYWLSRTFTWQQRGTRNSWGYNHGHSIIASDFGLDEVDPDRSTAPGGTYPALALGCQSCHNPHGTVTSRDGAVSASGSYGAPEPTDGSILGNYRLLGDVGYNPSGATTPFTGPVPIAVAPGLRDGPEADNNHTDYGQNMSEWCANCHGDFTGAALKHPAGNDDHLSEQGIYINYNSYLATGVPNTGGQATAYQALVPFERGSTVAYDELDPTSTEGPNGSANVMCLTCHRAHASAFPSAGRWYFLSEFLVDSRPAGLDSVDTDGTTPISTDGSTEDEKRYSYYNRDIETDFGPYQRSLCNKCHAKD